MQRRGFAMAFKQLHLVDTFQPLHPDLRAFTRVHDPSTGAGLDRVFIRASLGTAIQLMNAVFVFNLFG